MIEPTDETHRKIVDVSSIDEHVSFVTERREETRERHRRSNVSPGVTACVNVHARVRDVRSVAEVWEPPDVFEQCQNVSIEIERETSAHMSSMFVS